MRILGLDHGTRRIGVALSDEMRLIAQPLEYIPSEPFAEFVERLGKILREQNVELVVIGLPRNMDGSYGPAAEKVREFVQALAAKINVPIKLWDERLTTVQAQRVLIQGGTRRQQRKQKVDQIAAAILLQSYLDSLL
ncbi:MAG: Holliday junction resolvase RuvX [Verrucomicrobiae bacterium]|nr:Holliday junction resolvase RuvX [Verrucomicrobiae bacterium]